MLDAHLAFEPCLGDGSTGMLLEFGAAFSAAARSRANSQDDTILDRCRVFFFGHVCVLARRTPRRRIVASSRFSLELSGVCHIAGTMAWLSPTSTFRTWIDIAWIGGFAAAVTMMSLDAQRGEVLSSGVRVNLVIGKQRRVVVRGGERLAVIDTTIRRVEQNWRLEERFMRPLARKEVGDTRSLEIGKTALVLRDDLSLLSLEINADLTQLDAMTGIGSAIARSLGPPRIQIDGRCDEKGICSFRGHAGSQAIDQRVELGRGPVTPSAILPLLAKGALGNRAELNVFDPLTLSRRPVTYEVLERRKVDLNGLRFDAVIVRQDVMGIRTELWLDGRGFVLREQLPMGVTIEHESFSRTPFSLRTR